MERYYITGRNGLYVRFAAIMAAVCIVLLTYSCYDDKGTEPKDWTVLNELRIDTVGLHINNGYSVKQSETVLEIAPNVYYKGELVSNGVSLNDVPLDFSWVIYAQRGSANYRVDTLSTLPSLSSVITRAAGNYILLFTVTERSTKIQDYLSFEIVVSTDIPDGFVVLYENADGNSDVGVIANNWTNSTFVGEKVLLDIFSGSNEGAVLRGKPVSIAHSLRTMTSKEVLIASESDFVAVNRSLFDVTYTANDLFTSGISAAYDITAMGYSGVAGFGAVPSSKEWLIAENQVYYTLPGSMSTQRNAMPRLGDAMLGSYGELASWIPFMIYSASYAVILYDQTYTCFRYVPTSGVDVRAFAAESGSPKFNITNTGMRMVASDWGYGSVGANPNASVHYEYSLMKNGNSYALFVANWLSNINPRALANFDVSSFPGIAEASMVAAGSNGPVFYYSTPDDIYLCNPNVSAGTMPEGSKFWTAPAGEKITGIKVHKVSSIYLQMMQTAYYTKGNELLYVATWNESDKVGTVYQLPINPTSGARTSFENSTGEQEDSRSYSGFGKIKDMCWKWPY